MDTVDFKRDSMRLLKAVWRECKLDEELLNRLAYQAEIAGGEVLPLLSTMLGRAQEPYIMAGTKPEDGAGVPLPSWDQRAGIATREDWLAYCERQGLEPLREAERQAQMGHPDPLRLMTH